jgi:hypothetical protein
MQPAKVKRMPIAPAIFLLMATFYDSYGPIQSASAVCHKIGTYRQRHDQIQREKV